MKLQIASANHHRFAFCLTALLFAVPTLGFLVSLLSR
jgi:hypothetical protein